MEAKLIKTGEEYLLKNLHGETVAITRGSIKGKMLSKQNCDEIFGVVDVEKFAKECSIDWEGEVMEHCCSIYKEGFNKAMELNKDKLFTIKEVVELCKILLSNPFEKCGKTYQELTDNYIQFLQQPIEIEVEIEIEFLGFEMESGVKMEEPKLDLEGCLILKRL
jgi:hypothetical protein